MKFNHGSVLNEANGIQMNVYSIALIVKTFLSLCMYVCVKIEKNNKL